MSIKNHRSIFFSIFIISIIEEGGRVHVLGNKEVDSQPSKSITLVPVGDIKDDFLKSTPEKRQNYCKRALDTNSIGIPIVGTSILQKYLPAVHKYKFDDGEMLAIRCPTIPAMYIFEEKSVIHIRTLIPKISKFKFNFEIATMIDPVNAKFYGDRRKEEIGEGMSIPVLDFYDIDVDERWYLCVAATKVIRYKIEWQDADEIAYIEQPRFYSFNFVDSESTRSQPFLAFRCPAKNVEMFLRFGSTDEDRVIWIVFKHDPSPLYLE